MHTSCYVGHVYGNSVYTLHGTLDTSTVLRCARLLYFGVQTSCYVGHVYGTSVYTLHGTLDTSTVIRCTHFMLHWTRLLYFGVHTSWHVGHVYCSSVGTLHVALGTSTRCGETQNHPNVTFFEGVQHAFYWFPLHKNIGFW